MSDDRAQDIINRGTRAAQILDDETFKEAVAKIEADIIAVWKTWKADDPDGRERLWMAVNSLNKIVDLLRTFAITGRHERRHIEELANNKPQSHLQAVV